MLSNDALCRALLQQEQVKREALEERFLEQSRRAATVNMELIRTNTSLRLQLRAAKSQVSFVVCFFPSMQKQMHQSRLQQ